MDTSLPLPADPAAVSWVWRVVSSFRLLKRLLPIRERTPDLARADRGSVSDRLGSFDFEGPDTSLTQAHLEILK